MEYYLYCIAYKREGPVKIGISDNPFRRLRELQTGNPYKLNIYFMRNFRTKEIARFVETNLTHQLNKKGVQINVGGNEWFDISLSRAEMIFFYLPKFNIGSWEKRKKFETPDDVEDLFKDDINFFSSDYINEDGFLWMHIEDIVFKISEAEPYGADYPSLNDNYSMWDDIFTFIGPGSRDT